MKFTLFILFLLAAGGCDKSDTSEISTSSQEVSDEDRAICDEGFAWMDACFVSYCQLHPDSLVCEDMEQGRQRADEKRRRCSKGDVKASRMMIEQRDTTGCKALNLDLDEAEAYGRQKKTSTTTTQLR